MFRLFKFEKDIDEKLELVPLTVRRKFDLVGMKIHLREWTALTLAERRAICHLPASSAEERGVLGAFLKESIARRTGVEPSLMAPAVEGAPEVIPDRVAERLSQLNLESARWRQFDPEQRFALEKCAKDPERFLAAWNEFTQGPR